jgi:ParB family transcriptional regulator, chromosome partitioning protein
MTTTVQMIPIAKIHVLNSRARSKAKFQEITESIVNAGLRKPITVSPRGDGDGGYDLVCGQGRLEIYAARGETKIPALVVEMPLEDRLLRSLVENLARRRPSSLEMGRELQRLKECGYNSADIATKIGLSETYVGDLIRLMETGEERLVAAVERGDVPISTAVEIAASSDADLQRSLQAGYESGKLRGRALLKVRRLMEERRARGKWLGGSGRRGKSPSARDLVRTLQRETRKQELLVKKAHLYEQQLRFITSAVKQLRADEHFVTLLRAEGLVEMPKHLAELSQP